ncbi:protein C2-DOMAIN ABA-RELATED 4-like [Toxotes jaculatrix]|uniref:protein C2-DOMAIN ABA-RELATED 4-like n=1 Tax=Toxotes jaculatrix TaxID=941984 RepID=UPI001B3AE8F3|nr:protein C2-DOMAIN ABA-RELATED 4-like [Toxotes jaculatrix]
MKLAVFVSLLVVLPFQALAGSCVGKTVDVWVANGHGLTGDGLQDPDPYVVVKIGEDTQKTRVIHSNANPGWWEKLTFYQVTSDFMRIEVWEADEGLRGDDDHLGTCMELMDSRGSSFHVVQCTVKDSGFVKVFYKCY